MTPRKPAATAVLDLDQVVDELYGLPVGEFVAARAAHEKQARAAGDRDLADRIKGLAKPNQAAWLTNQLVRRHPSELAPLLELGADLREATRTLAGDQLRALSRQQHELTSALVQQARALGRAAGMAVSEATARGVQETLHAAMVDESAAAEVLAGRLTAPIARSGFGSDSATPTPTPTKAKATPAERARAQKAERKAEEQAAQRQARVDAQRALDAAARARDKAQSELERAVQEADDHDAEAARLKDALAAAAASAAEARKRVRDCQTALRTAERAVVGAARRMPG